MLGKEKLVFFNCKDPCRLIKLQWKSTYPRIHRQPQFDRFLERKKEKEQDEGKGIDLGGMRKERDYNVF